MSSLVNLHFSYYNAFSIFMTPQKRTPRRLSSTKNEGTTMSILQDLDPQNARLSGNASSLNADKMSWTAPLVLFGIAATGLFLALHYGNQLASMFSATSEKPAHASPQLIAQTGQLPQQLAAKEKQAALITVSPPTDDGAKEKDSLPAAGKTAQQRNDDVKQQSKKPATPRKSINKTALAKKPGKGKTETSSSTRKAAERDVDIITAIVR